MTWWLSMREREKENERERERKRSALERESAHPPQVATAT